MTAKQMRRQHRNQDDASGGMIKDKSPLSITMDVVLVVFMVVVAFCCIIPLWHILMSSISDGKLLLSHEGLVSWPVGQATLDGIQVGTSRQ